MSIGGGMAFVLSCTLSDRIPAVGMVLAGLDPQWGWCPDHRPVPAIAFHGTADPVFPYNGGWSKLGGATFSECSGLYGELVLTKPVSTTADDADVVLYPIKGEGHQWPGGKRLAAEWMIGRYSRSIDATSQMWAFFSEHQLTRK